MNLTDRKKERLSRLLNTLPDTVLPGFFGACEAICTNGAGASPGGLPVAFLRDELRTRALYGRIVLPARPPGASRMFFSPFEDLFTDKKNGHAAEIARPSLAPVWHLMNHDPALDAVAAAVSDLGRALDSGPASRISLVMQKLVTESKAGLGRLCKKAEEDVRLRRRLVADLGGEGAFRDMKTLCVLLHAVSYFRLLRTAVPAGLDRWTEHRLDRVGNMFVSLCGKSPFAATCLLLSMRRRLEKPWQAMDVYFHILQKYPALRGNGSRNMISFSGVLLGDLEAMVRALEDGDLHLRSGADICGRLRRAGDFARGMESQIGRMDDVSARHRIDMCREGIGKVLCRLVSGASQSLRRCMPVRRRDAAGRMVMSVPEFSVSLTQEQLEEACRAAGIVRGACALAHRSGEHTEYIEELAGRIKKDFVSCANDLVDAAAVARNGRRDAACRFLDDLLLVAENLLSEGGVRSLRDRVAALAPGR